MSGDDDRTMLREALVELLDVACRMRAGAPVESEWWYAVRDNADRVLALVPIEAEPARGAE